MKRIAHFLFVPAQLHADAAAARRTLQHHRITDALRFALGVIEIVEQAAARQQRHAVAERELARRVFQAEVQHLPRGRTDEGDAGRPAGIGKGGVLAEKTVTGVYGFGATGQCGCQNLILAQITFRRRRRPDADRFVGLRDVQ